MPPSQPVEPSSRPPVRLMGILNVTPDSFSDGGRYYSPERAVAQAQALVQQGADILDIGSESTRPGFRPVSAEQELRRLTPVLDALLPAFGGLWPVPLSIDTTKAVVARAALDRGATLVNDIWGFQGDADLPGLVAERGAGAVLMHNRHDIDAGIDIVEDIVRFFERSLDIASRAGVGSDKLVLDPGIGFGKTPAQQVAALGGIEVLQRSFGLPILVGVSRKSFLGRLMGEANDDRLIGTIAANLAARAAGASVFRVHDVAAHVAAFRVFEGVQGGGR